MARRRIYAGGLGGLLTLVLAIGAWAYFTANGIGSGVSAVGSMATPDPVVATSPSVGAAHVTWNVVPDPTGGSDPVTYTVDRSSNGGTSWSPANGSCGGTVATGTSACNDSPAAGTYIYRVTAYYKTFTSSGVSGSVTVVTDATPPTSTITFPVASTYYNAAGWTAGCSTPGSDDICGTAIDNVGGTGVQKVEVSLREESSGFYWDGFGFNSGFELWFVAGGTNTWSYNFSSVDYTADGQYRVRSRATDFASNVETAPPSVTFTIDKTVPANSLSIINPTGGSFLSGTSLYYRGIAAGSFNLRNVVSDAGSGPASSTFGAFGGISTGWTHSTPDIQTTPSGGPYDSGLFAWGAGTSSAPTEPVTGADVAGNTTTTTLSLIDDSLNPVGGALTVNGTAATGPGATSYNNTGSYSISTRTDYTDTGSGIASSTLTRKSATLSSAGGIVDGTCGSFGSLTVITGSAPIGETQSGPACYLYTLTGTDKVGNTTSISTTVKVDTTVPSAPAITLSAATGNTFISGTNVFINSQAGKSGSFSASATSTDADSGIQKINFPALTGFSAGGGDDTTPPYSSGTYTWSGAVGASGSQTVTSTNNALLTNTGTFTVTPDITNPTGGALTVNGTPASGGGSTTYNSTGSFPIDLRTDYTDAGSGLVSSTLTRQSAALTSSDGIVDGTCAGFGSSTVITGNPTQNSGAGIATNNCYLYTLTGTDRVGNVVSISTIVKVDTSNPTAPAITLSGATGNTFISGTTAFINPQAGKSGSFSASATSTDTQSGIQKINFPALTGFSAGGGDDTTSPYSSGTYTWSGAVGASGTQTVTSTDNALRTASSTFTVTPDTTNPSGSLTVNGVAANGGGSISYNNTVSFTIGRTDYTDAGGSGIASSVLTRASATLTSSDGIVDGTCGPFGAAAPITGAPTQNGVAGIVAGNCYQYILTGTDNVGNTASVTTIVRVDSSASTLPAITLSGATGNTFISGTTAYINAQAGRSGSFSASATSTDADSGILKINFPALTGFSAGGGDDTTSTYSSGTYTWSGSVGASGNQTVTATNNALLTRTNTFAVTPDTTGPINGAFTVNGTNSAPGGGTSYNNTGSYSISALTNFTDPASGLVSSILTRQAATLSSSDGIANGTCGGFGSSTVISGPAPISETQSGPACYLYTLTGTDNVGNVSTVTATIKVDTTVPSAPAITLSAATGNTFISGTNVFINSQAGKSGTFSASATTTDADSGIANVIFPSLTGFSSGGATDTTSPFNSTYNWSGAVGASGAQTVTSTNNALLTNSSTFTVTPDITNPTGTIAAPTGGTTVGGTIAVTSSDAADGGSGIATVQFQQQLGTSGGFNNIGPAVANPGPYTTNWDTSTVANGSYQVRAIITDRVGNSIATGVVTVTVNNTFTVTATTPQTAGTAFNVTITEKVGGVANTSYTGVHTIVFTGPANAPNGQAPTYPVSVNFASGVGTASVTLVKAQTTTITATENNITGTTGNIVVNAGTASALCIDSASACSGATDDRQKGTTYTSTVSLVDSFWNKTTFASAISVSVSWSGDATGSASLTINAGTTTSTTSFSISLPSGNNKNVNISASHTAPPTLTTAIQTVHTIN